MGRRYSFPSPNFYDRANAFFKQTTWRGVVAGVLITFFIDSSLSFLPASFFIGAGVQGDSNLLNPIYDVVVSFKSLPLDLFLVIGSYFWYLAIMFAVVLFVSRYFMAIAFDKALPTVVSYVSERFHSPVVAHLIERS
uniref:APC family permease n=1 Tax=Candidatus Aramenus sulfurataquae TaxID=1326980 RepID=A0A0F2LNB2_9CREN|nr:APC family permease [Candidatus Aramenus sulfurataquae]